LSRVTWATFVPILVYLGLSVLDLGPMYATDRRQTDRPETKASKAPSIIRGGGINITESWYRSYEDIVGILSYCTPCDVITSLPFQADSSNIDSSPMTSTVRST